MIRYKVIIQNMHISKLQRVVEGCDPPSSLHPFFLFGDMFWYGILKTSIKTRWNLTNHSWVEVTVTYGPRKKTRFFLKSFEEKCRGSFGLPDVNAVSMRFAPKKKDLAFKAGGPMRTAPSTFQQSHHKSLDQNRTWRQTFANHIRNEKPMKPETYVKCVQLCWKESA